MCFLKSRSVYVEMAFYRICYFKTNSIQYRGFLPKPGDIRIITFRVTTRLYSKSNRCI